MSMARYLSLATAMGLGRKDALLLEISTVNEMADIRAENMKGRGEEKWR